MAAERLDDLFQVIDVKGVQILNASEMDPQKIFKQGARNLICSIIFFFFRNSTQRIVSVKKMVSVTISLEKQTYYSFRMILVQLRAIVIRSCLSLSHFEKLASSLESCSRPPPTTVRTISFRIRLAGKYMYICKLVALINYQEIL
jgi:hypothetical protein